MAFDMVHLRCQRGTPKGCWLVRWVSNHAQGGTLRMHEHLSSFTHWSCCSPCVEWTRGSVRGCYVPERTMGSVSCSSKEEEREENWWISWTGGQRRRLQESNSVQCNRTKMKIEKNFFVCFLICFSVSSFISYFLLITYHISVFLILIYVVCP